MTNNHFKDEKSLTLKDINKRTAEFQRNKNLEMLLKELSSYLSPIEFEIEKEFVSPSLPPLFLVGNPRSGTTIFMQFLSLTGQFAVPTNFLSRFYYAPYLGAKIQQLITDSRFDYKGELTSLTESLDFSSNLGNTSGPLAPHEFNHFWRRFLPNYDLEFLNEKKCCHVDQDGLRKGIAAIENVFEKPFAAKALILQYNLDLLSKMFNKCLILYFRRNPLFIMQSILKAREAHYGNRKIWWSVKPKEYVLLKDMDVYHQIAGQVYFTDMQIEKGLLHVSNNHQLTIEYEYFCENPKAVYEKIIEKYSGLGCELDSEYYGPKSFACSNKIRLPKEDIELLQSAFEDFAFGKIKFS